MAYTLKTEDKELFTQNSLFKGRVRNILIGQGKTILKGTTAPTTIKAYKINNKLSAIAQYGITDEQISQLIRLLMTSVTTMDDSVAPGGVFDIKLAVAAIVDSGILSALQADFEVFAGVVPGDSTSPYPAV